MSDVMILLDRKSDFPVAEACARVLSDLAVPHEVHVANPLRTPAYLEDLVTGRDARVIVAVGHGGATLPGLAAAMTTRPVIGVPVSGHVPYDSLLSIVQAHVGIPVATVGVDRGENAGYLAAQMLGLADETLAARVAAQRERAADKVLQDDREIRDLVQA